jgi:uncharacterized membrane protein
MYSSRIVARSVWIALLVLAALGVTAGAYRAMYVDDAAMRAEPLRERILAAAGKTDPALARRVPEIQLFDRQYSDDRLMTLVHVVPGAIFLAFAPLQFSVRIRNRYRRFHRWLGRALLVVALFVAIAAFYFALIKPIGGAVETAAIVVFGGLFLVAIVRGFISIRRGDVEHHREWMIRAAAIAYGISTVRIVGSILDVLLVERGLPATPMLMAAMWIGWIVMVIAAEMWIVSTRAQAVVARA